MLGGGKASYFGPGVRADARGAQRAESWVEFSGRGSQLEVWGALYKAPAAKRFFFLHSRGARWPLLEVVGGQVRHGPLAPPP